MKKKSEFKDYKKEIMDAAHNERLRLALTRAIKSFRCNVKNALEKFPHTIEMANDVKKIKENKVQVLTKSRPKEITDEGIVVSTPEGDQTIPADTIIVANFEANNELVEPLEYCCGELFTIGDAVTQRRTHNAMMEGYRTGLKI